MTPKNRTPSVRLQKYLSECGVCSRRAAESLILEGEVRVNGQLIRELGSKVDPAKDTVQVKNKFVRPAEKGILLFHKPRGVVSTLNDPEGRRSLVDYLTKQYKSYFPVGRLDYESTGLVILTNDGELADRLMHPRFGVSRIYLVRIEGGISESVLEKIRKGVTLADGPAKAEVEISESRSDTTWLKMTVTEGRNRLIRRIMEKVGFPVVKLKRVAHGPFKIGKLKPGEIRKLPERDYRFFRSKILGETFIRPSELLKQKCNNRKRFQ